MTCKDCIHSTVCKSKMFMNNCFLFKDRSKFIELPCKLGDYVYYFDTKGNIYSQTIFQFIYGETGLKCDSNVMFDSELIGKRFFLTKEQAEQALKEREKE